MTTITTAYKGDMLFQTQINGHHAILADVPAALGGKDRAPTPPEYFVISMGTCVAAMVANYCNTHDIDATDMTVDVNFEKADKPTRLTDLKIKVVLPHADCMDQEKVLLRVAEHCPVHETINLLEDVDFEIVAHPCD
ncbi:MAG: OsmC family protein [Anaerolineae bacterium]|nr:OsmC family protein [Anaerolineae bacterium]